MDLDDDDDDDDDAFPSFVRKYTCTRRAARAGPIYKYRVPLAPKSDIERLFHPVVHAHK